MAQQETPSNTMSFIDQLKPMVQIQEEATVSRTVMSVEGANVVLFTFDKGQELSEHTAQCQCSYRRSKAGWKQPAATRRWNLFLVGLCIPPRDCRTRSAPSNRV